MPVESRRQDGSATCPECGRTSSGDQPFCECGFPLEFTQHGHEPAPPAVTRAPHEQDDDTAELPAVRDDTAPPAGRPPGVAVAPRGIACRACGEDNPTERVRCARCGAELRPQPAAAAPPAEPPPPRRSTAPLVVASLVALVAVAGLVAAVVWWNRADRPDPTASPVRTATAQAPAPGQPVPQQLPVERVTEVVASSVLAPDGGISYGPELTTDGRPDTAWNHDSGSGPAEWSRITYRFDAPAHVVGVSVVNGYDKVVDGNDLFAANHRVARALVLGESAAAVVTLEDTRAWQEVPADVGVTSSVTLVVLATHPGAAYQDVALSEVRFLVVP